MTGKHLDYYLRHLGSDAPAGLVVFLVALPLCLGIALASGAPPLSGIIAGVIGGLVVGLASGSQLSVSGPAAGMTVIVAASIDKLGGFDALLLAVALAGALQIAMGYARAGEIGAYFPSAVIKGMLAAIGLILIMKQVPHAIGYDAEADIGVSPLEGEEHGLFEVLWAALNSITPGAVIISVAALLIMLGWETDVIKRNRFLSLVPSPLLAVSFGVGFNLLADAFMPFLSVSNSHLVTLPAIAGPADFLGQFTLPSFSGLINPQVYVTAITLAVVGSLETLLSLEAVDKLDPLKRTAPTDRELKAQGLGNLLSGLLGGLPITAVIVRSSANINAGAQTRVSCLLHGLLLLMSVMFFAHYLNYIPFASLAAILLLTGYKLAKPAFFKELYDKGFNQFAPFVVTVGAILATDLLKGTAIGMLTGLFFVLRANYHAAITLTRDGNHYLLRLQKDVSFLNKALLRRHLESVEENGYLIVDGSKAGFIDQDILETLQDFMKAAGDSKIHVELKNVRGLGAAEEDQANRRANRLASLASH